jgi:hypothetical protein
VTVVTLTLLILVIVLTFTLNLVVTVLPFTLNLVVTVLPFTLHVSHRCIIDRYFNVYVSLSAISLG